MKCRTQEVRYPDKSEELLGNSVDFFLFYHIYSLGKHEYTIYYVLSMCLNHFLNYCVSEKPEYMQNVVKAELQGLFFTTL